MPDPSVAQPASNAPLPRLRTTLPDAEILERLRKASKRGKLAGFHDQPPRGASGSNVMPFWLDLFGHYFDRRLIVRAEPITGAAPEAAGSTDHQPPPAGTTRLLTFESRVKQPRIIAFWAIMVLSAWPGVLLVHSMMATYFGWYPRAMWVTCAWYLPVTVLPVPWMWNTAWKKSATAADAEARASIQKIATHLGATIEP